MRLEKYMNDYHFVNFVLQFISIHVMTVNIKINKNKVNIVEVTQFMFRYTLLILKIYHIM